MRVSVKKASEITATDLQELTLLLLHQAKSPLVAVDGFISMAETEIDENNKSINHKLLSYARSSSKRTMALLDTLSSITNLGVNGHQGTIAPARLDAVLARTLLSSKPSWGSKKLSSRINRKYKLPMVLADIDKLEESLRLVGQIYLRSGPGQREVLDISFRNRGEYVIMRLTAPTLAPILTNAKKVFLKNVHLTRLASEYNSELIIQCYIIRRNIELMGGLAKVEAKRGGLMSLYLHLPLSRQLQLTRLLGRIEVG